MSDYEIKEALQLRQQRFDAALKLTLYYLNDPEYEHMGMGESIDEAIVDADALIAKLEAPTR